MKAAPFTSLHLLAAVLFAVLPNWLNAAYLESDDGSSEQSQPDTHLPRPPPQPAPRPEPDNPLRTLVQQVEVGEAFQHGGLRVFPLTLRQGVDSGIATLDQALAKNWLTIREQEEPRVPTLRVQNNARQPVLLLAGEFLLGGRQNRIVREDVLLPAASGFVDVPVYCGEQRRWEEGPQVFRSAGGFAGHEVRRMAAKEASQAAVWQSIDTQLSAAKVEAPTRNYQEIYADKEIQRATATATRDLRGVVGRDTLGAVIFSHGRLVSCELFSDPSLFAQVWEKLCHAHVVDEHVLRKMPEDAVVRRPDGEHVRQFLSDIAAARVTSQKTAGAGESLVVSGAAEGRALSWQEQVVHATLFPARPVEIQPMPRPLPRPRPRVIE